MFLDFINRVYFENRILDYIISLSIILLSFVFLKIFATVVIHHLSKLAKKTETKLDDFIIKIIKKFFMPIFLIGSVYFGIIFLTVPGNILKVVNIIVLSFVIIFIIRLVIEVIEFLLRNYWIKSENTEAVSGTIKVLLPAIKVVVWTLGFVFLLSNLGVNISAMLAGLGISGIAIALATQSIFRDIFNYFVIIFDQPFIVGDYVVLGDYMGTIQQIGLKSTRIKSLSGEQIILSNSDISESRMRNFKRMESRRVACQIGVTYETGLDQLKEIPKIIEKVVNNTEGAKFDRAHFSIYGDFSLIIDVVYYVLSGDYAKYMDIRQKINFEIKEEFDRRGIEFAYPTQTIKIENEKITKSI